MIGEIKIMNDAYEYEIDYDTILKWCSEKLDEIRKEYDKTDKSHTRKQGDLVSQMEHLLKSMFVIQKTEMLVRHKIVD